MSEAEASSVAYSQSEKGEVNAFETDEEALHGVAFAYGMTEAAVREKRSDDN